VARGAPGPLTSEVLLRHVTEEDLPIFFEQQLDPNANRMAAFTARDPADWDAFTARWTRILGDETITKKTILLDGHVAGNTAKDNIASIRVLEKCGFEISGEDTAFSNARGQEVEEVILTLIGDEKNEAQ
jgi:RimJ/RimL family protein N-acetyltransferase